MENVLWRNCEIFEKQYQIFLNYTKDQHAVMRFLERMFLTLDFHITLFIEDLKVTVESLQNEFEATGISGTLRECFLYYTNNYIQAFTEMIKTYESKKRKYDAIRKYNTYESVVTSIGACKQAIITEYINACSNTSSNRGNVIQQTINTCFQSNSQESKRYHEGRISGHGFYLTNVLLKDFFKIDFAVFADFLETLHQSNFCAIASVFSQVDKLKGLSFEFEKKVNIDSLITLINDKYTVEYDVIANKAPKLADGITSKLSSSLEEKYEEILARIQSDKKIYYEENSCIKAIKQRLDLSNKKIMDKKLLVEAVYLIELLNKDFKISLSGNLTEYKELTKEKTRIKASLKHSSFKKSDKNEIIITNGKVVKPFMDPNTELSVKYNEAVKIFARHDGKYAIKNSNNQTLYVPISNIMISDRDQTMYDELDGGSTFLGTTRSGSIMYSPSRGQNKLKTLFKKKSSKTVMPDLKQSTRSGKPLNVTTDDTDYYSCANDMETKMSVTPTNADINDNSDLYGNYETTQTSESPAPMKTPKVTGIDYEMREDNKFENSIGLKKNDVYKIVNKSIEARYEKINDDLRWDEPVRYLGLSVEKDMCVVVSLRLNKKILIPIKYIKKNFDQVSVEEYAENYNNAGDDTLYE